MRKLLWMLGGLAACGAFPVVGNGSSQADSRQLSGFTQVENDSSLQVSVAPGAFSVVVTADSNLLPIITTQVIGDTLTIRTTEDIQPMVAAQVAVALPILTGLNEQGSGSMAAGSFDAGSLSLSTDGSGSLSLTASAGAVTLASAGSGSTTLWGVCGQLNIRSAGSGSVRAGGFSATGADVEVTGSGSVEVTVSGDTSFEIRGSGSITAVLDGGNASFSINGSGDIDWMGQTTVISETTSGSGEVREN